MISGAQRASGPTLSVGRAAPLPRPTNLGNTDPANLRRDPVDGQLFDVTKLTVWLDPVASRADLEALLVPLGAAIVGEIPAFNQYLVELPTTTITALEAVTAATPPEQSRSACRPQHHPAVRADDRFARSVRNLAELDALQRGRLRAGTDVRSDSGHSKYAALHRRRQPSPGQSRGHRLGLQSGADQASSRHRVGRSSSSCCVPTRRREPSRRRRHSRTSPAMAPT